MSTPEPEWLAPYIERRTAAFLAELDAHLVLSRGDIEHETRTLIRTVVGEMALHLTAPHTGPGPDPVREARETWAAGS